jgi:hypothetical protein
MLTLSLFLSPYQFTEYFDATKPLIIGALHSTEEKLSFIQVRSSSVVCCRLSTHSFLRCPLFIGPSKEASMVQEDIEDERSIDFLYRMASF